MKNVVTEMKLVVPAHEYEMALFAQSACNLSGICFSLGNVTQKICEEAQANGLGTDGRNTHPIFRMYAEQIAFLSGGGSCYDTDSWGDAASLCELRKLVAPGGKFEGRTWDDPEVSAALDRGYDLGLIRRLAEKREEVAA